VSKRDEFIQSVVEYLASGGTERQQALTDLIFRNVFNWGTVVGVKNAIDAYLTANPRGFCREGIDRFRKAILDPPPKTLTFTLTIPFTGEVGDGSIAITNIKAALIRQHGETMETPYAGFSSKLDLSKMGCRGDSIEIDGQQTLPGHRTNALGV
jgi:hypothetical protein